MLIYSSFENTNGNFLLPGSLNTPFILQWAYSSLLWLMSIDNSIEIEWMVAQSLMEYVWKSKRTKQQQNCSGAAKRKMFLSKNNENSLNSQKSKYKSVHTNIRIWIFFLQMIKYNTLTTTSFLNVLSKQSKIFLWKYKHVFHIHYGPLMMEVTFSTSK